MALGSGSSSRLRKQCGTVAGRTLADGAAATWLLEELVTAMSACPSIASTESSKRVEGSDRAERR